MFSPPSLINAEQQHAPFGVLSYITYHYSTFCLSVNSAKEGTPYELPGFRHYEQTTIRLDLGDRWFCTEDAAVKAGFTPARD